MLSMTIAALICHVEIMCKILIFYYIQKVLDILHEEECIVRFDVVLDAESSTVFTTFF